MKKAEAIKFIRQQRGFVPYIGIFDVFGNNDEIPQAFIDLECKRGESKPQILVCSAAVTEQLNKLDI